MLTHNTLDTLRHLKLTGMGDALEQQRAQPETHDLAFEERLALLVDREVLHRENRRLDRLLKAARLRVPACIEDIDYRHPRGLERSRMAALASSDWIRQSLNLCITGPTGCGKTWLACALGNQACRQGLSVRYLRVPRLFEQLRIAHAVHRFLKQRPLAEQRQERLGLGTTAARPQARAAPAAQDHRLYALRRHPLHADRL